MLYVGDGCEEVCDVLCGRVNCVRQRGVSTSVGAK